MGKSAFFAISLILLVVTATSQETGGDPLSPRVEQIRPGETKTGTISPEDPESAVHESVKQYSFVPLSSGSFTILLDSYDFDAILEVRTEDGEKIAKDFEGGVETNARVLLDATEGTRYILIASAKKGQSGEFLLKLEAGEIPLPAGAARLEASVSYRAEAARRALEREDRINGAKHRLHEAQLRFSQLDFTKSVESFQSALRLAREMGEQVCEVWSLHGLGRAYHKLRQYDKAEENGLEALSMFRKLKMKEGEGWALNVLGETCLDDQRYPEAIEYLEEGLKTFQKLRNSLGEAYAHYTLGRAYRNIGKYQKALEFLETSLTLYKTLDYQPGVAFSIENLALVHEDLGNLKKTQELHEHALVLFRDLGDIEGEAIAVGNLGNIFWLIGNYEKARECYERKLSLATKLGDRKEQASAFENLGLTYSIFGNYSKTKECYQKSIDLGRKSPNLLGNLGMLYFNIGDYGKALESFENQLAQTRAIGQRNEEAYALQYIGMFHYEFRDYLTSLAYHKMSLDLAREIGNRIQEAKQLLLIGAIFWRLDDYSKAEDYIHSGLEVAFELHLRPFQACAFSMLGNISCDRKEYSRSIEYKQKSLAINREMGEQRHIAVILANIGLSYYFLGNYEKAKQLSIASMNLFEKLGVYRGVIHPLDILARIDLLEGDHSAAEINLSKALEILNQPTVSSLGIEEASKFRSHFSDLGQLAQDLTALRIAEAGRDARSQLEAMEKGFGQAGLWKGRALLEGIVENFKGGRTTDVIQLRHERTETLAFRQEILKRVSGAIRDEKPKEVVIALRDEARSLKDKADALSMRLRKISPKDASLEAPKEVGPGLIRHAVLDEDTVLIDYAEGTKNLYAYVLTKQELRLLDLGKHDQIEKAIDLFLSGISNPDKLASIDMIAVSGMSLFGHLLAPIFEACGDGFKRLLILPTPALAGVPFEALVINEQKKGSRLSSFSELEFVIDRHEVSYGPSSPILVELASVGPRRGDGRVLVLADPWYPSEPAEARIKTPPETISLLAANRAESELGRWVRLKYTRREALTLGRLLLKLERENSEAAVSLMRITDQRSGSLTTDLFDLYLGKDASPERLQGDLEKYSILHLAAHGFVDREYPQRSGLALASQENGEGYLTIRDVLDLDLDANLVVLSACNTARGKVRAGEGVQSLARAFMYAGSRAVIASLWMVADWAAAETFESFYQDIWERNSYPAEALRKAKLDVRHSKAIRGATITKDDDAMAPVAEAGHPFFWAPFIHVGLPIR